MPISASTPQELLGFLLHYVYLHTKIFVHETHDEFKKYDALLCIKSPNHLYEHSWNDQID